MTVKSSSKKNHIPTPTEPTVSVAEFTDPTAVVEGMEFLDQDVIGLDQRPFLVKRVMMRLANSLLLFQWTSHRVRTYTKVEPTRMAFVAIGPTAKGTLNGISLRPELLIIGAPEVEAEFVVDAGYSSVSLLIPPDDLLEHLSARGRGAEFRIPNGIEFLRTKGMGARLYYNLGKRLTQTAKRQPKLFNDNGSARIAAHIEILETLLSNLGSVSSFELSQGDQRRLNYSRIIKTVEAQMLTNAENRLYVSDLCSAAGVSERTLQYAFHEVLGTTPMAYMNLLRLHRARTELRAASRGTTTVSAVALNWGFWHFADFSRAYKKHFQELPSETLRTVGRCQTN